MTDTQEASPRRERFDPMTGKLLADAPRFDPITGARYKDTPTRFLPRRPGAGWITMQAVWTLLMGAIVAAGVAQDLHHAADLAIGIFGVVVLWSLGVAVIATTSYLYRRWRRDP